MAAANPPGRIEEKRKDMQGREEAVFVVGLRA